MFLGLNLPLSINIPSSGVTLYKYWYSLVIIFLYLYRDCQFSTYKYVLGLLLQLKLLFVDSQSISRLELNILYGGQSHPSLGRLWPPSLLLTIQATGFDPLICYDANFFLMFLIDLSQT